MTSCEIYERKVTMEQLHAAIATLPDKPAKIARMLTEQEIPTPGTLEYLRKVTSYAAKHEARFMKPKWRGNSPPFYFPEPFDRPG